MSIAPYTAVALQTTVRHCAKRSEVERNLVHILEELVISKEKKKP